MNNQERIKEFALEAAYGVVDPNGSFTPEEFNNFTVKFAELIVRELSAVANYFSDGHEVRQFDDSKRYLYFVDIGQVILEHFGVEETKGWVCPKCGTDRTTAVCPKGHHASMTGDCPMAGVAQ